MKALRRLNAMVGKEYIHNAKNIIIKDLELIDEGIIIETDGKPIKVKTNEIPSFIEDCLPVDQKNGLVAFSGEQQNTMTELKSILMSNIKKCQDDPAYVKQATVINNNVNTLINMVSLELKVRKGGF